MKDQFRRPITNRPFITINNIITAHRITALLAFMCFGSDVLKILFSNFVIIMLTYLAISSPTDFNASIVMGMPTKETKMHNA